MEPAVQYLDNNPGIALSGEDIPTSEPVSLSPPTSTANQYPTEEIANRRTAKTIQGLGSVLDDPNDVLHQRFIAGQENAIRNQAALKLDMQIRNNNVQKLKNMISNTEGTFADPNYASKLIQPVTTDPDMVIEKAYTDQTLSSLNTANAALIDTPWSDQAKTFPQVQAETLQTASDFGTKREYLQTFKENIEQDVEKQSYLGRGVDELKRFSQVYQEAKLRGLVDGVSIFAGLGYGANVEAQAKKLFDMDNDTFKRTVTPILLKLKQDNPSLAAEYVDQLMGQTDSEKFLNNLFTVFAPIDLYQGTKLGYKVAKGLFTYNAGKKAVRDILKEARNPDATGPDIQAAAGDLSGSAINEVGTNIVKGFEGTAEPAKENVRKMTENFNLDIANIETDVTPRNREAATRLQEQLTSDTKDIPNTILQANKVERIPLPIASQQNLEALENSYRDSYRGPWNSLLDVKLRPEDYDPFTNTHWYRLQLGHDGKYFSNPETAANWARDNGHGDARIIQGVGNVAGPTDDVTLAAIKKAEDSKTRYLRLIDEQAAIAKDKTITAAARKEAKENVESIKNVGIAKQDAIIQKLRLQSSTPETAQRIAEIDKEIKAVRETIIVPGYGEEHLKELQKNILTYYQGERAALTSGRAEAIRPPAVKQQGVGYYIEKMVPLNETQPVVRDLMIKSRDQKFNPDAISDATSGISSWKNAFIGKYRSPEDTLSKIENEQRKTAVYAQSSLRYLGDQLGKHIEDIARGIVKTDDITGAPIPWYFSYPRYYLAKPLNILGADIGGRRQMFKEWEETVDYARRAIDPVTKQEGYFFKSLPELENHYLLKYQRMPSYSESLAYFAKVEMDEYNRVLTNRDVYRNKARLGAETHTLSYSDGKTQTKSPEFDGVAKSVLPGGDGNMAVFEKGKVKIVALGTSDILKDKERWTEQVLTGKLRAVELYDPEARPLRGFAGVEGQRIQYILSDAVESKPISYNQVNRRGGGHFDYEYDHYLKQAIIRNEVIGSHVKDHYEGDTTVMALPNRIMGQDIGKHLDEVRKLIKDGKIDLARDYTKQHLMMEFEGKDGVHSWFKPGRDPNGKVIEPRLNLNEPFYVVKRGGSIYGMDSSLELRYPKTFQDGTRHGSLARQFQVAYTKERDAQGLTAPTNTGTRELPIYKYEPAKLVDAMPTLNRALGNAIKSTYMDDYKIFAVEHWLREAEPYLKNAGENYNNIRSSPFFHFRNPDFKPDIPKEIKNGLMHNKYKIDQFVGVPNEVDTTVHALTQHLVDSMYEAGSNLNKDSKLRNIRSLEDTKIIPIWMLHRIHDPVTKLRSITFNAKLGLFNLPQVLVQAQTYANIWAIAGRHGGAGTYAALLHGWSKFGDEAFLQHLDGYASKMNFLGVKWKPGEFAEARNELSKTGFEHVAGEFATLDDAFSHKFVQNDFNKFLDLGQAFFRGGERSTRIGAYYTAFKEFRDLHPVGILTNADRASILQRADFLTVNMSRASSSALHSGVLGLTTQFLSYQLRLAELFMGKRLGATVQERTMARMRLMGMYSALYGVPAAIGVTGIPASEEFRSAAINQGYIVGDNFVNSLFMEGIPALVVAMVTGGGDFKKGQFYNIGDRYGAQGFTQIREALRSDGAWWKILGGAGVTTAVNTITNADGFTRAILSFARGDSTDSRFVPKLNDLVDLGKEISSVNSAWKVTTALNTGKWLSKNEGYITDVSPTAALWMGVTGTSPQEQSDIFTKTNIIKSQETLQKYVLNKYIQEIHRAIAAKEDNNPEQAHDYMTRANNYLTVAGYPMEKRMQAISIALKNWESRVDTANFDFYLKNVPTPQADQRVQTYKQQLELNQIRKQ